jgi:hypothetical protein
LSLRQSVERGLAAAILGVGEKDCKTVSDCVVLTQLDTDSRSQLSSKTNMLGSRPDIIPFIQFIHPPVCQPWLASSRGKDQLINQQKVY